MRVVLALEEMQGTVVVIGVNAVAAETSGVNQNAMKHGVRDVFATAVLRRVGSEQEGLVQTGRCGGNTREKNVVFGGDLGEDPVLSLPKARLWRQEAVQV
jgi:hypothetical protein